MSDEVSCASLLWVWFNKEIIAKLHTNLNGLYDVCCLTHTYHLHVMYN